MIGDDSSLPFALNQKTIEALKKACSYRVIEKVPFSRRILHIDLY
jgi:hypothetical protein